MEHPACAFIIPACKKTRLLWQPYDHRFRLSRETLSLLPKCMESFELQLSQTPSAYCNASGIMRYQPYVQTAIFKEYYFRIRGKT